ncbi:hypothetical protein ACVWW7_004205 [Bradyrhizobium sp. LM6.9]
MTFPSPPRRTTSGTRCAISARCISGWRRASSPPARSTGDARVVTFANGSVAREVLVDCDDARQRLVYAINSERLKHYSASVQVIAEGDARCRLVWIIDMLPNELAAYVQGQTGDAVIAIHKAFPA